MTSLVVGASAGLGRALAERLAASGHDLVIVSSDERDLDALAADLRIRHGIRVAGIGADLGTDEIHLERLEEAAARLGGVDGLFFPIGWTLPGDDGHLEPTLTERLVRTNFLSVATVVTRFLPELRRRPRAAVVGFGSVAATRGRGANVVYSASKRALQTYFEGLRCACMGTRIAVQFYVLGYLDTNLAFGRRTLLPRASPERLASRVVRNLSRGVGVVYYPRFWRPLCAALSLLPWALLKRLKL